MVHYNFLASLDVKLILIIFVVVLVVLILFHFLFSKSRFSSDKKSRERKIKSFIKNDDEGTSSNCQEAIKKSKRYDGSFNSLSSSAKSQVKKYLINWVKNVPEYITISRKLKESKYKKVYIFVSDSYEAEKYLFRWEYNPKKNAKYNSKSLIKMLNKFKITYATIDLLNHIYVDEVMHNKEKSEVNEYYSTTENNYFIKYRVSDKKNI